MKLLSIIGCYRELKAQGHKISRKDLYSAKETGRLKMVGSKTSPEAVLAYLDSELGILSLPAQPANQHQPNGCKVDEQPRSHGRKAVAQSNDQPRRVGHVRRS